MAAEEHFTKCDYHAGPQLSWIVCVHVVNKERAAVMIDEPTPTHIGALACWECSELEENGASQDEIMAVLKLICGGCVKDMGLRGAGN